MDHLPRPKNPAFHSDLTTPYLCTEFYDDGPFETYPDRHGWSIRLYNTEIEFLHHDEIPTKHEVGAFLQTWLYFGLISTTLGVSSVQTQSKFVRFDHKGQAWLTSCTLEQMVIEWSGGLAGVSAGMTWSAFLYLIWKRLCQYYKSISGKIFGQNPSESQNLQLQFSNFQTRTGILQPIILYLSEDKVEIWDDAMILAMCLLEAYLIGTWGKLLFDAHGEFPKTVASAEVGRTSTDKVLKAHMRQKNWCPSHMSIIFDKLTVEPTWYFANMEPPGKHIDHSQCTGHLCIQSQITSQASYKLSHTEPDCRCPQLYVDVKRLREILEAGETPVFDLKDSKDPDSAELVILSDKSKGYVAISHIWSEGLGSYESNSLQYCEIKRLFKMIRALPVMDKLLWIDTLAVPVLNDELKHYAIGQMRHVYKDHHVLLLDRYCQSFKTRGREPLEIFSRVFNSTWVKRFWCLQEGLLARTVWVKFADKILDLNSVFDSLPQALFPMRAQQTIVMNIAMNLQSMALGLQPERKSGLQNNLKGVVNAHRAVKHRGLTEPTDEAICLAVLLDLDVEKVVATDKGVRMEILWSMIKEIPLSLVFSKSVVKCRGPGFRWAPSSFRTQLAKDTEYSAWAGPSNLWEDFKTNLTPSGLTFNLPGFLIHRFDSLPGLSSSLMIGDSYVFYHEEQWFYLSIGLPWSQLTAKSRPERDSDGIAVILHKDIFNQRSIFSTSNLKNKSADMSFVSGIIADITQTKDNTIYVAGQRHVAVGMLSKSLSMEYNGLLEGVKMLRESMPNSHDVQKLEQAAGDIARSLSQDRTLTRTIGERLPAEQEGDIEQRVSDLLQHWILELYLRGWNVSKRVSQQIVWCLD